MSEKRCGFCGKSEKEVEVLISGPGTYICDKCIQVCNNIMEEHKKKGGFAKPDTMPGPDKGVQPVNSMKLLKPDEIKSALDRYVVGQENAKKTLSVAVYNHYKRVLHNERNGGQDDVDIQKSNVIMVGPTGSGKTYIAKTLAKIIGVPFAIADATSLTEAGYVGDDVETILAKLFYASGSDVAATEKGIIYIDEIDKIAKKKEVRSSPGVGDESVQNALLKIMEGTEVSVPLAGRSRHPGGAEVKINTKNILFICGGAFSGIEKIFTKNSSRPLGFGAALRSGAEGDDWSYSSIDEKALIKYGLVPEFIGRLPIIVTLEKLDEKTLVKIISEPKDSLYKQYQTLLSYDNVGLRITDNAMHEIAKRAIKKGTGARGLRSIMEKIMEDAMYIVPSDDSISECIVTVDCVRDEKKPRFLRKKSSV